MNDKIKSLLKEMKVANIKQLIEAMESWDFFKSPASSKWHGNYEGGLVDHSLNVYELFKERIEKFKLTDRIPQRSIVICSLLHDMCKAGSYRKTDYGFQFVVGSTDKGHANYSIERISSHIQLTTQEEDLIKYHMGYYSTIEFGNGAREYTLSELANANQRESLTKLFYWCDDMASQFIDKKK